MTFVLIITAVAAPAMLFALWRMRNEPKGLYILFFAEMWERFSYYGMRGLLIFYLTQHFLFSEFEAYGIYGAYATLVYILPVIGGVLADRYLGARRAVTFGALLLVLGHGGMAFEGSPTPDGAEPNALFLNVFYLSLALIACGVGFLKANISTIVGQLYQRTDTRRDGAFTLFYVGINMGSFLGAAWCGYLGQQVSWSLGFGLAGIGMLAGLIVFVIGKPLLKGAGESPNEALLKKKRFAGLSTQSIIYLGTIGTLFLTWLMVRDQGVVGVLLSVCGAVTFGYILYRSVFTLEKEPRHRIFAALVLIFVQVVFSALFDQAGSSLNIYTDRQVDRTLFGQEVPASVFQSLNAGYIIYLGPLFAAMWIWLGKRGLEPSAPQKFGLGIIQAGLGFLVLVWGAMTNDGLTPVIFIFLVYLLHTTGELCLSPVGLSAMTRLSVGSMVGLMMGAWFLATAFGNYVAAIIAQFTAGGGEIDANSPEAASVVIDVYNSLGWIAVGIGVFMILISPLINRLMHLDTLTDDDEDGLGVHQAEVPIDQTPRGGSTTTA